jgi:2-polyprenyl-6-methoxyphenol hydroxylase-like FAD-dependent oxidoreductase
MRHRRVVVLGGGVTGLACATLLGRDGHAVTLVERDPMPPTEAHEAADWARAGIPHFHQPHAFIPMGRKVLLEHFPDVHAELLVAGAADVDVARKAPGERRDRDEELQYLAVRRPLIEWGLRRAARERAGVRLLDGANVTGLECEGGRVRAVVCDRGELPADVVVDALGRRSPVASWLAVHGFPPAHREESECGVLYYSRYYRARPGRTLPDGPWLIGPRGDLGYMAYSTFPGDSGAFAEVFAVPPGVPELKTLRHEAAFEAAIASVPGMRAWANTDLAEPISPVRAMGGLRNALVVPAAGAPVGLFAAGDTRAHTDPVLAHGMAFGLLHAVALARALRLHDDDADANTAYDTETLPAARERYALSTALDAQRLRLWSGEGVDVSRQNPDYEIFSVYAGGAVSLVDPDVFRVIVRRMGLLDSTRVLDEDAAMRHRIEERFAEMTRSPRPAPGPDREAMFSLLAPHAAPS